VDVDWLPITVPLTDQNGPIVTTAGVDVHISIQRTHAHVSMCNRTDTSAVLTVTY